MIIKFYRENFVTTPFYRRKGVRTFCTIDNTTAAKFRSYKKKLQKNAIGLTKGNSGTENF